MSQRGDWMNGVNDVALNLSQGSSRLKLFGMAFGGLRLPVQSIFHYSTIP